MGVYTKIAELLCCEKQSEVIDSNIYRVGSEKYFEYFNEKRAEFIEGKLEVSDFDKELLSSDIGKHAILEKGQVVPLDCPMVDLGISKEAAEYKGKDVELNKPKRGGSKKFYVYVQDPKTKNVKKVEFGDTTGLTAKINDPEARKSFVARHDCKNKKDKTKPGYWACRLPYYAKQLGLSGGGSYFW